VRLTSPASPYITFEMVQQQAGSRWVLHILNYDHERNPELRDLAFEAALPATRNVKSLRTLSPDRPGADGPLQWSGNKLISFRLPTLKIYTVVVIDLI